MQTRTSNGEDADAFADVVRESREATDRGLARRQDDATAAFTGEDDDE